MSQIPAPPSQTARFEISTLIVQTAFFGLVLGFLLFMAAGVAMLAAPLALAFLIAFALNPAVDFLESLGLPRILATTLALLLFVGAVVLFFEFVVPLATSEIRTLLEDEAQLKKRVYAGLVNLQSLARGVLPESVVLGELAPDKNLARIEGIAGSLLPTDFAWLGDALTYAILTPILTFIFLLQGQEIYRSLIGMVPNRYFEMAVALVNNMRNQIIAYLRGLSMQWLIMLVIAGAGFYLIGLPYAPLAAFLVATTNLVPYLGPMMGVICAAGIALLQPGAALLAPTLAVIGVAQLVDNIFTQPVVLAGSVEIHPVIAALAVIALGQYFGMAGMLVAIPLASIVLVSIEIMYKQLKAFGVI